MATSKVQTGIRFEADMLIKLHKIAKKNRRTLNAQLEFLAQQCIEAYEEEHGEIEVSDEERYAR